MGTLANLILYYIPPTRLPRHSTPFIIGGTAFSTLPGVLSLLAGYLVVVFGIKSLMNNRKPYKLTSLFQLHNIFLSLGSALLLALMFEEIGSHIWRHGLHNALCSQGAWTPRMEIYYRINYYFKYLEFFDTVFLALKKKPLSFLHVYHHSITALFCFMQIKERSTIAWPLIMVNLAVHVIMYYYYYATAGGARLWWKKYLTTIQIVQFVFDILVVSFCTYENYAHKYYKSLPHFGDCMIEGRKGLAACTVLASYLVLFVNFYFQTYKSPTPGRHNGVESNYTNDYASGKAIDTAHKVD